MFGVTLVSSTQSLKINSQVSLLNGIFCKNTLSLFALISHGIVLRMQIKFHGQLTEVVSSHFSLPAHKEC